MDAKLQSQCLLADAKISKTIEDSYPGKVCGEKNVNAGEAMDTNLETQHLLTANDNNGKKSLWNDTNLKQKFTFIYSALGALTIFLCQNVPAPFLGRVVLRKGGERFYSAAIMHSTYLLSSVASLTCGKYQERIPTKTFVWLGLLILATTQGCFGFLKYVENIYVFLVVGFLVKAIQGIGQGIFNVALLTLLWQEFPDHIEKSFGMTKVMYFVGCSLGPLIGSHLFSIGNEILIPFMVSAALPLLLSFIGYLILPHVDNPPESSIYDSWSYICKPKSIIAVGLAATSEAAFAVYDASFTTYAQTMGVSVVTVGLILAVADAFSSVTATIAGYASDVSHVCRKFFLITCFCGLLGTNFAFVTNQSVVLLYIEATIFISLGAVVQTLAFPEMIFQSVGDNDDLQNDFSFRSKLSGSWYFVITLSMFSFGVVGTEIQNVVSYSMSLTITSFSGLAITVLIAWLMACYRNRKNYVA